MVNRSRPTLLKREREKARQQKQKDKTARRLEAKGRKPGSPRGDGDEDPDIAGIVPGPQPMPWLEEMEGLDFGLEEDSDGTGDSEGSQGSQGSKDEGSR